MIQKDIELVKAHKDEIKGQKFKVGEGLTPVKVVGIGPQALKVLVYEASRFTKAPVWKDQFINYKDDMEKEYSQLLLKEMVKSISQKTLKINE